tara:strand:+ start:183 stop:704 length:522 start_codon:yes stop_codon:yes gene_type:complete
MANTINQFSERFGQGQRATLFQVTGDIPESSTNSPDRVFFIKSAQFPASSIGFIEVPFKGRKIKRPGDRTFAEWTLTVLQDDAGDLRADFVRWMNKINAHVAITGDSATSSLFPTWTIESLRQDDSVSSTIELVNCFPTEVGAVDFNYETVDTFTEFTVTLQYDYWTGAGTDS